LGSFVTISGCWSSRHGSGVASHGFAADFEAMGVVDKAVEDGCAILWRGFGSNPFDQQRFSPSSS
jgi:hypothetical protein